MLLFLLTFIRIILFFISNFGYYNYIRKRTQIHISYLPVITIGIQVSSLILAGILNLLLEMTLLLYFGGIILFISDFIRKEHPGYKAFFKAPFLYMFLSFAVLWICLSGKIFTHYDNFTHWAIAVKDMLITNKFPNFQRSMIIYSAYPLGSTSYIYYFCRLIGSSESYQMLAQAFMMTAAIMPLFSFTDKHPVFMVIFVLLFSNFVFSYLITLNNLLVDTLLPLFGIVTITFTYRECYQKLESKASDVKTAIFLSVPLLITTLMIKNSGILFSIFAIIILLIIMKKKKNLRKSCILAISIPFLFLLLWKKHCMYCFNYANFSIHAMTIANYKDQVSMKSVDELIFITSASLKYMLTFKDFYYVIAIMGLIIAVTFILKRDVLRSMLGYLLFMIVVYGVYTLGICGMYVFSMPTAEAITLSGINRYAPSIIIVFFYIVAQAFLTLADQTEGKSLCIVSCLMILSLLFVWKFLGDFKIIPGKEDTQPRLWLQEQIDEYEIPQGASFCIFSDDSGYYYYLGRYLLWSENASRQNVSDEIDSEILDKYDYLIFKNNPSSDITAILAEKYPEQLGNTVIKIS